MASVSASATLGSPDGSAPGTASPDDHLVRGGHCGRRAVRGGTGRGGRPAAPHVRGRRDRPRRRPGVDDRQAGRCPIAGDRSTACQRRPAAAGRQVRSRQATGSDRAGDRPDRPHRRIRRSGRLPGRRRCDAPGPPDRGDRAAPREHRGRPGAQRPQAAGRGGHIRGCGRVRRKDRLVAGAGRGSRAGPRPDRPGRQADRAAHHPRVRVPADAGGQRRDLAQGPGRCRRARCWS